MRQAIQGLAFRSAGAVLLFAGAAVVLAGLSSLFRSSRSAAAARASSRHPNNSRHRTDYFTIRQTRSELGYTYWVLQGHGRLASFALFDTWREAMDAAGLRLAEPVPELR